jgi:hypothetical protein
MSAESYNVKVGIEQGGDRGFVKSGGALDIESGGALKIAGTDVTDRVAALGDLTVPEVALLDASASGAVGTVAAPTSGTVAVSESRVGDLVRSTFTLTAARIVVTDGAGSGSHGSLKLYDFPEAGILTLGSRQNYTAFVEGAALTGAQGDAVFEIGLGSVAISAAADGSLGATNDDIGGDVNVTLSGGTSTGTGFTGAAGPFDGTSSAKSLYLNWSGTAGTIDATSSIDVTGTITVVWVKLGDD